MKILKSIIKGFLQIAVLILFIMLVLFLTLGPMAAADITGNVNYLWLYSIAVLVASYMVGSY